MKHIQEGSMQSKESESFGATEAGALFPRLHVKETKVSGLRAPPRNKMALFEQFTIPPHRFVPPPAQIPSQKSPGVAAFYVSQASSYDGRYMCSPSYQTIPCMSQHQMARQSIITQPRVPSSSSCSVVSACDKKKHQANSGSSVVRTKACSSAVTSKAANDQGQASCQNKDLYCTRLSQSCAGSGFLKGCSTTNPQDSQPKVDYLQRSVGPSQKDKALSPCLISMVSQKASLKVNSSQTNEDLKNRSAHMLDNGEVQNGRSSMHSTKGNVGSAIGSSSASQVSRGLPVEICQQKCDATPWPGSPQEETHAGINDKERRQMENRRESAVMETDRCPNQKLKLNVAFSHFSLKNSEGASDANLSRIQETTDVSLSNQHEDNSHCRQMSPPCSRSEESDSSEPKDCCSPDHGSDSIDRSSNFTSKLTPKEVIGVIGQRDFWKARKALILQQKIFSEQVFELHRLLKVQQLIATMPALLTEEDFAILNKNICEMAPAELSENLGGHALHHLGEKPSIIDKRIDMQPSQTSHKEQMSHPWHNTKQIQQSPELHQQSGYAGPLCTQFFQGTLGTWGYPVASSPKTHGQKLVDEKPGSLACQTRLGAGSDGQVLNNGMVDNSRKGGTAPATLLSPIALGIPADKVGQTKHCMIQPDQLRSPVFSFEEISPNKDVAHSSVGKPGSDASQNGCFPQSGQPTTYLRKSLSSSKGNPSIKKYQWLENTLGERQSPDIKKQRFQKSEFNQAAHGLDKTGFVEFSGSCTLQRDNSIFSDSCTQQKGFGHAINKDTSTTLTEDSESLKRGHAHKAEAAFCYNGNFSGSSVLPLFPLTPAPCPANEFDKPSESDSLEISRVIKAVPRSAVAASESTAIILKSIQQERWQQG